LTAALLDVSEHVAWVKILDMCPDKRTNRRSWFWYGATLPVSQIRVELIGTVVAHDFQSTGKKLRRPRRIAPWREGRVTRGKLLFVHIWKLPP
jgi:hypothetical protein